MTDFPIIFSAPMVMAQIAGRKIMTRRLAWGKHTPGKYETSPAGGLVPIHRPSPWQKLKPGDRLYVRENYRVGKRYDVTKPRDLPIRKISVMFAAGGSVSNAAVGGPYVPDNRWPRFGETIEWAGKLRPGIFLPRWASRLTWDVAATRIEPIQAITDEDAIAEGITRSENGRDWWDGLDPITGATSPRGAFYCLWCNLHGAKSWDANPEVVVISAAKVHQQNIDQLKVAA